MAPVQEGVALRPLGVGDIVDRVFAIYRSRPLLFLAVSAIPYLLLVLLVGALALGFSDAFRTLAPLLGGDVEPTLARIAPAIGTLIGFGLLVAAAALVTSLIQSAALVDAAASRYLGRDASVGSALRVGLAAAGRLFVMGALAFLAICALWILLAVLMAVVNQWWIFLAGTLSGLVATFYLAASWMVSPAVATLEGLGPVASLRRSWWLAAGHRWRILGIMILLFILQAVLSGLISLLLVASIAAEGGVQLALQQGTNLLTTIAWAPVYWGTFAVLYYDLRVRKEAFDLELAAAALPRAL